MKTMFFICPYFGTLPILPFISINVGNARLLPGGIIVYNNDKFVNAINEIINNGSYRKQLVKEVKDYTIKKVGKAWQH